MTITSFKSYSMLADLLQLDFLFELFATVSAASDALLSDHEVHV